jgi:hypothetical protein
LKAVGIHPFEKRIVVEDVDPTPAALRRLCGAAAKVVARLPNSDVVLASAGESSDAGFSIGGSKAIRGPAVVLGKRTMFGERAPARSSIELLEKLVRWVDPELSLGSDLMGETISVILVDPEEGTIGLTPMVRAMAGMDELVGGEAVELLKAPGDDLVYGNRLATGWRWRKDDCLFKGRCVIVGSDRANPLMDPVASVEVLRRTVRFGPPGKTVWLSYDRHPGRLGRP